MARFVAVDLKLAGGSVPATAGLKWLVEKGYRTVLDLRDSSEVPSSFIAEVTSRGLRYVALPISLTSIDREHLARFNFEIASGEARPLFFFDSDGTRAGALWYIRRITNDRVDRQIAKREAEELGLSDPTYWSAVTKFVTAPGSVPSSTASADAHAGRVTPTVSPVGSMPATGTVAVPDLPPAVMAARPHDPLNLEAEPPVVLPSQPLISPAAPCAQSTSVQAKSVLAEAAHSGPSKPIEPVEWRPFAAMVITGLSLPLAYWSRTIVPIALAKARASLPAPAHRPKSIAGELGA
jgi:protein tyrosine phosphatase (PTP) superfamily phosphohydrolase (DUF442 family)